MNILSNFFLFRILKNKTLKKKDIWFNPFKIKLFLLYEKVLSLIILKFEIFFSGSFLIFKVEVINVISWFLDINFFIRSFIKREPDLIEGKYCSDIINNFTYLSILSHLFLRFVNPWIIFKTLSDVFSILYSEGQ